MKVTFKSPTKAELDADPRLFGLQLFAEEGEEDQGLSDDELNAMFEEDPDLKLAIDADDDDDEDEDVDLDDDEDELKRKRAAKKAARLAPAAPAIDAATQSIIDDIRLNPDKYKGGVPAVIPEPVREQPKELVLDLKAITKQFAADLVTDPEMAAGKFLGTVMALQKQSEDRIRRETRAEYDGVATQTANQTVRAAMSEFDNHPAMTPDVKKEFKTLVAKAVERGGKAIANMKPEDVASGLRSAFAEAIGNVAMNVGSKRERLSSKAPVYAPRNGGGARPNVRATPQLSSVERDVINNMRAAGITDAKVLKQTIREMRAEEAAG